MILRQARAGDAPAICAIANPIIRDTLITFTTCERVPADVVADIAARGAAFQLAELDGTVAGFASYVPFRRGPGYAFTREHSIQLAPWARRRGVGRALMERLEAVAAARQVHALVAAISAANPAGIAFHARLGFAETGRLPEVGFKAGRWLDLVMMQKILPPASQSGPDSMAGPR